MPISSKRILRSTNKRWYQFIPLDHFKIYFASPKKIPAITQHFAKVYSDRLIGLSFEKILATDTKHFPIRHFLQLTNLTHLSFKFSRGSPASIIDYEMLTKLTNLCNWQGAPADSRKLPNLTTLRNSDFSANLKVFTNLRELQISAYTQTGNPFAMVSNPSRMTFMEIGMQLVVVPEDDMNTVAQFKNLKSISLYQTTPAGVLPRIFRYLTNIETAQLWQSVPQDDFFLLTRLTRLSGLSATHHDLYKQFSALHNLKILEIAHHTDENYCFLTALTNLEELRLPYAIGATATANGLSYISSQKITSLHVQSTSDAFNVDSISRLISIRELTIGEANQPHRIPKAMDGLSCLTNLTKLYILTQWTSSPYLTVLNTLKNLKDLNLANNRYDDAETPNLTLSDLTNLETLTASYLNASELYMGLTKLTSLTSVILNVRAEAFAENPTVLRSLTKLRRLAFSKPINSDHIWDLVTTLTALEFLEVWRVPSEEVIESFSVLTNLTSLSMRRSHKVKGIHLTKLTSLQSLNFISKPAKKLYEKDDILIQTLTRLTFKEFRS